MKTSNIKYTTLFDYTVKNWNLGWSDCHKIFFGTNAIYYGKKTETFYLEDLESEINDEVFPPLWSEAYGKAMRIICNYMKDSGKYQVNFIG